MSTLNSGTSAYCTAAQMLTKFDVRTLGDYLSDTGTRLTSGEVATALSPLLKEASGMVEGAATRGNRYTIADLAAIAAATSSNACETLAGMVAGIAMFYAWERRPASRVRDEMPMRCKLAFDLLDQINAGGMIFPFLETAEAGDPQPEFQTPEDIQLRNPTTYQARRYFGQRANMNIPGAQG